MPRIVYIQYTNPAGYPPLEHSSTLLANAGWEVLFLGTSARRTHALRFPPHPHITVRQLSFPADGWRQKLHFGWFLLWGLGWVLRWRSPWVYASDPLSCPLALLLSYLGVLVIYHEHDSPVVSNQQTDLAVSGWFRQILRTRAVLARRAISCVLPNAQRMQRFDEEMHNAARTVCVWNCPMREEVVPPRQPPLGNTVRVVYHGSLNALRLPLTVLQALAQLPPAVTLSIVGYETVGHLGYLATLRERAQALGLLSRVEFVGTLPQREELLSHCRQGDVGLTFMPRDTTDLNEQDMTGASNKPFDYLACGLALLVADRPDWRTMFVEPGYGLACDPEDAESIAAALQWFLEHPAEMREMGERGRQRIATEWHYERQFAPVLAILKGGLQT
jgi:glycosyltransferase involved in cell wall biosynthesis